jgi:hypothetical protein
MSDTTSKAVFLSYASPDAAAVLRIAEALRAAGVEVWFDEARALMQNSQSTVGGEVSRLMVLARTGQKAEVEKALADPARPIGDRPMIQLALGRPERALAELDPQKAISYMTDRLLYSPDVDPIRAEPRFVAFLAEIGATEGHARAQAWRAAHPAGKPTQKQ